MGDEKIIIKVDDKGDLTIETKGIVGPACIKEVKKLLDDSIAIVDSHKTDEYYMEAKVSATSQVYVRKS
jgi:hypothetical protein